MEFWKRGVRKSKRLALKTITIGLSPFLASLVAFIAETGIGSEECLRRGALPLPVHFYSPIPDFQDLLQRRVWDRRSELVGIDFRVEDQLSFLKTLGSLYGEECHWPYNSTKDPTQFYVRNNSFSYGCAAILHCMMRNTKPNHVIEIGSGFSSLVISAAIQMNIAEENSQSCNYTIIDPYPNKVIESGVLKMTSLVKQRVELLDVNLFTELKAGDILFIDTSHTVKIGSDVNYLILELLPRLAPGVIIHVHDINLPYEYPKVYTVNPAFRMFWTEAYLLQAFLIHNNQYEVLLAMNYLMTDHYQTFCEAFKHFKPQENWANSGSIWIRRCLQ